jgi:hypothetical protein
MFLEKYQPFGGIEKLDLPKKRAPMTENATK